MERRFGGTIRVRSRRYGAELGLGGPGMGCMPVLIFCQTGVLIAA